MFFNSTDDPKGWLYQELIKLSLQLQPVGVAAGNEILLAHYSLLCGVRPNFASTDFHWTTHISNCQYDTFRSTGLAMPWTDVFLIKLSWPAEWDDIDIANGLHIPLNAQDTRAGWEFALNFQEGWLEQNGLSLPLTNTHMGHISIATDPATDLFMPANSK